MWNGLAGSAADGPDQTVPHSPGEAYCFDCHYNLADADRKLILTKLAKVGQLWQASVIAAELGFSQEAIEEYGSACLDRLRRCHFYPILKSLNGDF